MNEQQHSDEVFYVCAGICREDPDSGRCVGCGRPWSSPETFPPVENALPRESAEAPAA